MQSKIKQLFLILGFTIYFSFSLYADSLTNPSFKEILKGPQDILPADQSFKFSAFQKEDRIILTWELKENCFLYKDKFGNRLVYKNIPIESIGIYVPANLPSTLLMNAIPAKIARVKRIVMLNPKLNGEQSPGVLYASKKACLLCQIQW